MKRSLGCILVFIFVCSPIYAGWYSEKVVDAITDEESLVIFSDEENVLIRCESINEVQTTFVAFIVPAGKRVYVSDGSARVLYRFDKEPHGSIVLEELRSGNGLALTPEPKDKMVRYKSEDRFIYDLYIEDFKFIRNMILKERLLIRIPTGSTDTDLVINLDGLSEILTPHLRYCGLDFKY